MAPPTDRRRENASKCLVGLAMGGPTSSGGSSSGEEDGDAEWKAAIQSIAATTSATFTANGFNNSSDNSSSKTTTKRKRNNLVALSTGAHTEDDADEGEQTKQPQKLKHYQIKVPKLSHDSMFVL